MWFGGFFQEPRNFIFTFATDPESYLRVYAEDIVLPADQAASWIARRDGVLVGREVAEQYGWSVGDQIPLSTDLWVRKDGERVYPVVVSAIYDAAPDAPAANQVLLHFEYLNEARSFGTDEIGSITVRTADPARNQETIDAIDALFANSRAETETITEAAFNQAFVAQLGNIGLILIGSTSAAFVTILMIVGNAMAGAVRERTKEIAVMKTLGFTSGRIGRIVLSETVLLALIGGLIGLGVATVAVGSLKSSGVSFFGQLEMTPMIYAQGVAIMLGLGLVTGLLPAIYAIRINVIRAFGKG
jgi:putative ABC transport system permease protein